MSNTFSGEDEEEEEISAPDDFDEAGTSDPQQEEEQVQYSTIQYSTAETLNIPNTSTDLILHITFLCCRRSRQNKPQVQSQSQKATSVRNARKYFPKSPS